MKIDEIQELEKLKNCGVYKIQNLTTGKVYIGSTTMTFARRFQHHSSQLNCNKHKNQYFQNAWNKYGKADFNFDVLEITNKQNTLEREQYWINYYDCTNPKLGYNINPMASGTPNMCKEVIARRTVSIVKTHKEALIYYKMFKNGEVLFNEVPKKYQKVVAGYCTSISNEGQFEKGREPWNKGLTLSDELKKKFSDAAKGRKHTKEQTANFKETVRNKKGFRILVYDYEGKFLMRFRSPIDLSEWSETSENNLPVILVNPGGRNGKNANSLMSQNITKVCMGENKHYKGLIFRYENSDLPIVPLTKEDFSSKRYKNMDFDKYFN